MVLTAVTLDTTADALDPIASTPPICWLMVAPAPSGPLVWRVSSTRTGVMGTYRLAVTGAVVPLMK